MDRTSQMLAVPIPRVLAGKELSSTWGPEFPYMHRAMCSVLLQPVGTVLFSWGPQADSSGPFTPSCCGTGAMVNVASVRAGFSIPQCLK